MIVCYFDGACGPKNPNGNLGIGALVIETDRMPYGNWNNVVSGKILFEHYSGHMLGSSGFEVTSNNMAEYIALIAVLEFIDNSNFGSQEIIIRGDSMLVIRQMRDEWKIKSGIYCEYAKRSKEYLKRINAEFEWIPREYNQLADDLSNRFFTENGIKTFER